MSFSTDLTISQQNIYLSNIDYQIDKLLKNAKRVSIGKQGIFKKFVNKKDQDYFDFLTNHAYVHIELFELSTTQAIDNLSKCATLKSQTDIIDDLYLVDMNDQQIRSLVEEQAQAAFENELEFDTTTVRKRLFKRRSFLRESIALHARLISKHGMKRCTTFALNERKNKNKAQAEFLEKTVICGPNNQVFALKDAGETNAKRLNELYVICKGIEKLGEVASMKWASVVVTAPGRMHPNPSCRAKNSVWDGTLPNETAKFLHHQFARLRASLAKKGITLSGFWTRESHLDATPHVNFLIYFNEHEKHEVQKAFDNYFGHSKKAIKWQDGKDINEGKKVASFASYSMKYFQKFFSKDAEPSDECVAEQAWASAFSLRRYGFFGIPSIEQWRRLRAKREAPEFVSNLMMAAWRAARRNDAAAWIAYSGGLGMKNTQRPFKTLTEPSTTGKSRIAVGVEEVYTGLHIISKKIGEYTMLTLRSALDAAAEIKKSIEQKSKVTVALSYPRYKNGSTKNVQSSSDLDHFNHNLTHVFV